MPYVRLRGFQKQGRVRIRIRNKTFWIRNVPESNVDVKCQIFGILRIYRTTKDSLHVLIVSTPSRHPYSGQYR
jgi:hypothetical protein